MHQKKQSVHSFGKAGHAADDSQSLQRHIKQVSKSVINSVDNLEQGNQTVNFLIKFAEEDSKESQDLFEQMRKKMTDRSAKVKRPGQSKREKKEKEEAKEKAAKEEMEETKRRLREAAKKMNRQKERKKKRDKRKKEEKTPEPQQQEQTEAEPEQSHNEQQQNGQNADDDPDIDAEYNWDSGKIVDSKKNDNNNNEDDGNDEEQEEEQKQESKTKQVATYQQTPEKYDGPIANEEAQIDGYDVDNRDELPIVENNYGYPQVHDAFKQYYLSKNVECKNPTHLILFAKKGGIPGVTFANANKYFKHRKNDPDKISMDELMAYQQKLDDQQDEDGLSHLMSNPSPSPQPSVEQEDINNGNISDASGHSGHGGNDDDNVRQESPIQITQSTSNTTPDAQEALQVQGNDDDNADLDDNKSEMDNLTSPKDEEEEKPKKRRKSKGKMDGKKKKKKLLVAAEMLGKLKKNTPYTKFQSPLYILPLNVAEQKKAKDEKRLLRDMGLQPGYKVMLKMKNMKGTIFYNLYANILLHFKFNSCKNYYDND